MDIDELTGRELDVAVAKELGEEFCECKDSDFVIRGMFRVCWSCSKQQVICRARNIFNAWELDGEGWEWNFDEHNGDLLARVYLKRAPISACVQFSDFPTKAEAYATARCRAWLKARREMKGDQNA